MSRDNCERCPELRHCRGHIYKPARFIWPGQRAAASDPSRTQTATSFIHDTEVGVKCTFTRGFAANQSRISICSWRYQGRPSVLRYPPLCTLRDAEQMAGELR